MITMPPHETLSESNIRDDTARVKIFGKWWINHSRNTFIINLFVDQIQFAIDLGRLRSECLCSKIDKLWFVYRERVIMQFCLEEIPIVSRNYEKKKTALNARVIRHRVSHIGN